MAIIPNLPRADDDGVLAVHDEPYTPLGSCYMDAETGFFWQYVKAAAALVYGDAVQPYWTLHTITNLATAAAAGSKELNDTGETFLTSLVRVAKQSRQKEMAQLQVTTGTGNGQSGIITEIQQTRLIVEWDTADGGLDTALDTTSDIVIYAKWLARKAQGADAATIGFVQQRNGVAQDKYFWAMFEGDGVFHAGAAITAGATLSSDATNGRLGPKGDAHDNSAGVSHSVVADGERGHASLKAQIMLGEVPIRTDIGYTPSTIAPPVT